jgi:hypothetical protein
MVSSDDKAPDQKKQRTSLRVFLRCCWSGDLETVRREKGRLRSYLLVSLKHFLTNERHHAMTIKRGEGRRLVPLDALGDHEGMASSDPTGSPYAAAIRPRRIGRTQ